MGARFGISILQMYSTMHNFKAIIGGVNFCIDE